MWNLFAILSFSPLVKNLIHASFHSQQQHERISSELWENIFQWFFNFSRLAKFCFGIHSIERLSTKPHRNQKLCCWNVPWTMSRKTRARERCRQRVTNWIRFSLLEWKHGGSKASGTFNISAAQGRRKKWIAKFAILILQSCTRVPLFKSDPIPTFKWACFEVEKIFPPSLQWQLSNCSRVNMKCRKWGVRWKRLKVGGWKRWQSYVWKFSYPPHQPRETPLNLCTYENFLLQPGT